MKENKKLLPFSLERALAGYLVVDDHGRKYPEIVFLRTVDESICPYPVIAVDESGVICNYNRAGVHDGYKKLFMAPPKTKTYYANVFKIDNDIIIGDVYSDQNLLEGELIEETKPIKNISFEIEE